MKILISIIAALALTACAKPIQKNGKIYEPYGLVNEESRKSPDVKYEISFGSVVVAIVFCESIIAPIYIVGWDLYQPLP